MPLYSAKVPNLLGGVSQLPADQRQPNQVDAMDNCLLSRRYGATKRPPSQDIGRISASQTGYDTAFVHSVNRTSSDRYTVVVANGAVQVFDSITGVQKTVLTPNGSAYLVGDSRGYRAFTVGDHTFIVNRSATVKKGSTRSAAAVSEALLFVRQADFSTHYTITLDGETIDVVTSDEATMGGYISTDSVAQTIYGVLTLQPGVYYKHNFAVKFDFTLLGSTIHVKRKDGTDFLGSVADGLADKGLRFIKGSVQAIEDLPTKARPGMVIEIAGDPGSPNDNSWVVFEQGDNVPSSNNSSSGDGLWRETVAPGLVTNLDHTSMPWELVRMGYLTTIQASTPVPRQPTWRDAVGTETTNGWTTDGSDVALSGAEVDPKSVYGSGALRTPAVNGTSATKVKRVRIVYDIDAADGILGIKSTVVLSANVGAGWVVKGSTDFQGGKYPNQTFELDMVCPAGTRFELKLITSTVGPAGAILSLSRLVRLTGHGSSIGTGKGIVQPGVRIADRPSVLISLGTSKNVWPAGMVVNFTIDTIAFTYTLATDMTTAALHTALSALIDAHAAFVSTYTPPSGFPTATNLDEFVVSQTTPVSPPAVTVATATLNTSTHMWSPSLSMTPGAQVGRVLKNLTDGSQGTITANSGFGFTVGSLTGGTNNTFSAGDQCAVLDTASYYFVLQPAPWVDRLVGDDTLSPFPSFVGRQINEVFFHAGRLGFLAEDFILLSATNDVYRFFRSTVTQVLDDDPIDIQNAHKDVSFLDAAVEWQGQLFLTSSAGHQFTLTGEPVVTPATVKLEHITSFPAGDKVRPLALGTSVYFPRTAAGYSHLREVFHTRDGIDSNLNTAHVPTYLQGNAIALCGDYDLGFIAILADQAPQQTLYVYNFGPLGPNDNQSAWHRWIFSGKIIGIDFFDGYLYLVIYRGTDVRLERINVGTIDVASTDYRDLGGVTYTSSIQFSRLYLRDQKGDAMHAGRTQLRTIQLNYHDTGNFLLAVGKPNVSPDRFYTVDSTTRLTGRKRFPVLRENYQAQISVSSLDSKGFAFSSMEFEATYGERSQRM